MFGLEEKLKREVFHWCLSKTFSTFAVVGHIEFTKKKFATPVLDTNFFDTRQWATTCKWNKSLAHEDKPLVQKSPEK